MIEVERPTAICVAPNGGRPTKADHPFLPLGPAELARTAQECLDSGSCLIHVHVRDQHGRHVLDATAYRDAIDAIGRSIGDEMIVQITSESLGRYTLQEQIAIIREARPEAVSLAIRELVPTEAHETEFASFLSWLQAEAIVPQIILYDADEALRLDEYHRRGLVPGTRFQFFLCLAATPPRRDRTL